MNEKKPPGLTVGIVGTGRAAIGAIEALIGQSAGQVAITDPIGVPPEVAGEKGRAWLCDRAAGYRMLGVSPADDASLDHWVIEAPWAHPLWHSYSLVLVHLRPMPPRPGVLTPVTRFYLEHATHELWLYALDPQLDRRRLLASGIVRGEWMQPKNFAAQFVEVSDDLARGRVRASVQEICDGALSPDTDHRQAWIARYGDNMQIDRPGGTRPVIR